MAPALPAPSVTRDGLTTAFHAAVDRLESVVVAETEALAHNRPVDVSVSNHQKRQGLLELSRLLRAMPPSTASEATRARLARLTGALERNQAVLGMHLKAVRDVADIVAAVMRDAESDGTYTARAGWQ